MFRNVPRNFYANSLSSSHCRHACAGPPDSGDPNDNSSSPPLQDWEPDFSEKVCGEPLLKLSRGLERPVRRYAFQSFSDWLACLLSRPHIESYLEKTSVESSKPYDSCSELHDIYQSRLWKEFVGPDGKKFTANPSHLTFALFVDAINPLGNKQSGHHMSITFVILVCLGLPPDVRHCPENVFVVGIAPGPREPSLEQMNWILQPIVSELQSLWSPGLLLSRTHDYPHGRLIRAALMVFVADIPSLRRCLGFPSATATFFCSFCLLTKNERNNLDQSTWPPRTWCQHTKWAREARDAKTFTERKNIFESHGVRYSVRVELEYWNIIEY